MGPHGDSLGRATILALANDQHEEHRHEQSGERPERVVLLSAPQAFFGLVFNGWVLALITIILTVTAWITVVQRVAFVYTATTRAEEAEALAETEARPRFWARNRAARPLLKGE